MSESKDAEIILNAGAALTNVQNVGKELLGTLAPTGYHFHEIDIAARNERMEPVPRRNTGHVRLGTTDSFCRFVQREHQPNTTVCFADLRCRAFKVIFNYPNAEQAGWQDRTVHLELVPTPEWIRWNNANRARMSQVELADFIEENLEVIAEPTSAELLEMISALRVRRYAQFDSVVNQADGQQTLAYTEEVKNEVINGNVQFVSKFKIGIIPFKGAERYGIDCHLRFSADRDKSLRIFFSMINVEAVLQKAFDVERDKIIDVMTSLTVPVFDV